MRGLNPIKRVPSVGVCAGLLACVSGSVYVSRAEACGGFFCSRASPVDQTGEEIIFVQNPDMTVTAVIQIQYSGPSQKFAWVLPIPGVPAVSVSSNVAFSRLRAFSDPNYTLNVTREGACNEPPPEPDAGVELGSCNICQSLSAASPSSSGSGVVQVAASSVGPYDYSVIEVDPRLKDPATAALTWLRNNGYDVTSIGPDLLRPYLADGLNLIAFKLTKGSADYTGSIRPVVLTYASTLPAIPIRLTAVAAQNDMGILVFVLGDARAVPSNYKSLSINDALVDWFNHGQNYQSVVTAAANEAGGQGFVTEMADDSVRLDQVVFSARDEQLWSDFANAGITDGFEAITKASSSYRNWDGWTDAIRAAVTLPANVSFDDFGRDPMSYRAVAKIDASLFVQKLHENVIAPVVATQKLLLSRAKLTRLFSTMSADEMTMDPTFDFNAELPSVSNEHSANQIIECAPELSPYEAPWRIELPQGGGIIHGLGTTFIWPVACLPANRVIMQLGTSGLGQMLEDNGTAIDLALSQLPAGDGGITARGAPTCAPTGSAMDAGLGGRGATRRSTDATPYNALDAPQAAPAHHGCSVGALGTRRAGLFPISLIALGFARRRRFTRR